MANGRRGRRRRGNIALDALGGRSDGAVAILGEDDNVLHMTSARVAGAVRFFIARLQYNEEWGMPARLAVTSAIRGEGVTYFSRALASVLAYDTEARVGLVDFNWLPPTDDPDRPLGLADVLERGASLDDVLRPTKNPRLTLVPPGAVALARRPALAGSADIDDLMDQLGARFDHLILDLPPVLASSETISLTQLADEYVLVVRHGVTTDRQVQQALDELRGKEAMGVILNRYRSRIPVRLRRLIET